MFNSSVLGIPHFFFLATACSLWNFPHQRLEHPTPFHSEAQNLANGPPEVLAHFSFKLKRPLPFFFGQ